MFRLLIHHDYKEGDATDLSGNGHHGRLYSPSVVEGRVSGTRALSFNGISDRVIVAPIAGELGAVRATAWIWLEELGRRQNIIEGYLSFTLFVEADGSLRASLYRGSKWLSMWSTAGLVPVHEWVHIQYIYNGADLSALYINNRLIASRYCHLGRVQGIRWPFGLHIGAWPDADHYALKGRIGEVRLWSADPDTDGKDGLYSERSIYGRVPLWLSDSIGEILVAKELRLTPQ